ncbi:hypothetical protein AAEH90_10365 [Shewanella algae]|uniref:competence protein CoiA family protein n=1 Tax=Shewanella algae TaxID=38313 RepID=UPI00313BDB4A
MEYAVNKFTGKIELAELANTLGRYICHECRKPVSLRSGRKRKAYFAHWRGYGSPECEKFVPGGASHGVLEDKFSSLSTTIERMELRLKIPSKNHSSWYLELTIPPCRESHATVMIDVGGRFQTLDMRGMSKPRKLTAEPTTENYRIVSFTGKPDPQFVNGVVRECNALRPSGATVFSSTLSSERQGFSVSKEIRLNSSFAMLWKLPRSVIFPEEITVDSLTTRGQWHLAMITVPSHLSIEATLWFKEFTGLEVSRPTPSINVIWPFVTRRSNLDEVVVERANEVLLGIDHLPDYQQYARIELKAIGEEKELSVPSLIGSEKFFLLESYHLKFIALFFDDDSNTHRYLSIDKNNNLAVQYQPTVDIALTNDEQDIQIFSLHISECESLTSNLLKHGYRFSYISMPKGVEGRVKVYPSENSGILLIAGSEPAPHNHKALLLKADMNDYISRLISEGAVSVELDFGGFGNLYLNNVRDSENDFKGNEAIALTPLLRGRLLFFLSQIHSAPVNNFIADDELIRLLESTKPKVGLIPHYRSIKNDILRCGDNLKIGINSI